ncbi:connectin-like [Aricia agestis]|uniref:connectin-like n=1 Tax=Aricia agestis TaxID=91739 RepID=UPI001C207A20|nr:connectin-like [Aricia agestis]XP_041981215.1 connectin-like [Aricia agestis]
MAHWRIITLLCIAIIIVDARRMHAKRETKSHLCDPVFNNTNKIQCYCAKDSRQEIIKSAECFATIDGVEIDDKNWEEFSELQNATKLVFMRTSVTLKYIPEHAFKHTKRLHKVEVKYANIEAIQPFAFANLSAVREIILSDNQIKTLQVHSFAHHKELEIISLDANAITEINRDVFIDLPSLQKLYLTNNKLITLHDRAFIHLTNLKELEIDRNSLFSLNSETFSGLSKLEKLDLSGNSLEVIGDNTFLPLKNLKSLNLEGNKIQLLDSKAFKGLAKLESLSLAHNALTSVDNEKTFDGLKSLVVLSLKGNKLANLKPEVMAPILENFYNNASNLDVEDNNFPCACQLDWFLILLNKTRSPYLKVATENLKCNPTSEIREKWNKAAESEKNVEEENAANNDYEYYDDTQLNGKLFYVDMRYLLNCSNVYNNEVIDVQSILNPPTTTTKKPVTELPKVAFTPTKPEKPKNEVTTKLPDKYTDNNDFTTSKLATVSAKPDDKYEANNMAADEGHTRIKAYRSTQEEIVSSPVNSAIDTVSSVSMIAITLYLTYLIKY